MLKKVDGSQASISGWQQTGKTFEVSWEGRLFILTNFHQRRALYHPYQWSPSFFFFLIVLLKHGCFTVLSWFLLCSKVIQLYTHTLFSIMVYHRALTLVPGATQEDLVVYPSSIVCICQSQTPTPSLPGCNLKLHFKYIQIRREES